jgi:hypothetical protein
MEHAGGLVQTARSETRRDTTGWCCGGSAKRGWTEGNVRDGPGTGTRRSWCSGRATASRCGVAREGKWRRTPAERGDPENKGLVHRGLAGATSGVRHNGRVIARASPCRRSQPSSAPSAVAAASWGRSGSSPEDGTAGALFTPITPGSSFSARPLRPDRFSVPAGAPFHADRRVRHFRLDRFGPTGPRSPPERPGRPAQADTTRSRKPAVHPARGPVIFGRTGPRSPPARVSPPAARGRARPGRPAAAC